MGFKTPTKTVKDVADSVKRTFGDESGVQITDADILRWVNQAQQEIVSTNQVLKGVATRPTEVNVFAYTLGESIDIQYIHSIHVDGTKTKYMSFQDAEEFLINEDPYRSSTGRPTFWYEWGGVVNFYPTPDSVWDISIYYNGVPSTVTGLSDLLSLPDNYFNRILEYVNASAYELDENFNAHQVKMSQFDSKLVAMTLDEENSVNTDFYPMITVLAEDL